MVVEYVHCSLHARVHTYSVYLVIKTVPRDYRAEDTGYSVSAYIRSDLRECMCGQVLCMILKAVGGRL